MENKPKPTRHLVSEVLNLKARLDSLNLYREYEMLISLNNQKLHIMESYDWSDQEFVANGKSGLMDCFGEVLIPAGYDETWFRSNYFVTREKPIACRRGDKWGMVLPDGRGTQITEFLYDNVFLAEYYSFWNLVIVVLNGKYGFIDIRGHSLTPVDIDEIWQPANDMGQVRKGDKYGFIYFNGEYVEPVYDEIAFSETDRLYHVKFSGRWGYVDRTGNFVPAEERNAGSDHAFYGVVI
jgi:hypothetical protein